MKNKDDEHLLIKLERHKDDVLGETIQRVEIYYKMIGQVPKPNWRRPEKDSYKKSFGRTKKEQIAC